MTAERLAALKSGKVEVIATLIRHTDEASPYGQIASGLQRTWTGKIISLDEWRRATEWDRHGSTGKMWNGLTQQWEETR